MVEKIAFINKETLELIEVCSTEFLGNVNTKVTVGDCFGRLTVLYRDIDKKYKSGSSRRWVCKCDCGSVKTYFQQALTKGKSESCGCLN